MKKLILLAFAALIAVTSYSQDQKISAATAATTIGTSDIFPLVQSGTNKKVPFSVFYNYFQTLDADLTAISGLSTTGFAKRTGTNTWTLDNSTYLTGSLTTGKIPYYNGSALANGPTWDNTNTRLGLGTTAPDERLQLSDAGANNVLIKIGNSATSGNAFRMGVRSDGLGVLTHANNKGIVFETNNTETFRLVSDGTIRIATAPTNTQAVYTLLSRDNSASGEIKTFTLSSYAATLLDDANAATSRATLGVTPGGSTNELQKNNGSTGFTGTELFSSSAGTLTIGSSSTSVARSITVASSNTNAPLFLYPKGTENLRVINDYADLFIGPSTGFQSSRRSAGGGAYFSVFGSYGIASETTGQDIWIAGGTGYNVGNTTGGDVRLDVGPGHGSGGADGNLIVDLHPSAIGTTHGNFIILNLPTSSAGLPSGALWNNAGVLSIVP
jgi:hypothetical protein